MFSLSATPIDRDTLIKGLQNSRAGALVTFEGWVRDHNQGEAVRSLEYEVYESLAQKEGTKILQEAREKFNIHDVVCIHRSGHLPLESIAVWIGAIASHRDDAFKATRYVIDQIKLRLPIWKKEHYINKSPEWVFCKDHATHVHFEEHEYYQRQSKLISPQKLKTVRVLVVGAGGLGCPVLTSLTMAGVGHIDFLDFDRVSISNLHRQLLYSPDVVGEKKTIVAQKRLQEMNSFIHVHGHDVRLDGHNVQSWIANQDLVLDCTDNLETKYLLHDACFTQKIPLISASIYRYEGQLRTFDPRQDFGCLRCDQEDTPQDHFIGNCNDIGVLGASVQTLGSLQAQEALNFLNQGFNATLRESFFINFEHLRPLQIKNRKNPQCRCCAGQQTLVMENLELDIQEVSRDEVLLLDIRDQEDSYLEQFRQHKDRKILVYCHRGIRSKHLVRQERAAGHTQFYSLKGGACSL